MTLRFVNQSILISLLFITLTGLYGIVWVMDGWIYEVHRLLSWALVALIPWKVNIAYKSIQRRSYQIILRPISIAVSLALSFLIGAVFVFAWMWAWRVGPDILWLYQSVISWHWIIGLATLPPLILHASWRWVKLRKIDFISRRGILKLAGIGLFGWIGWIFGKKIAVERQNENETRNYTGSRLNGYLTGNNFPITTGAGDGKTKIDIEEWHLDISGAVKYPSKLTYQDIISLPKFDFIATLDCTIGWYTIQRWQGIQLTTILSEVGLFEGAWSISLRAISGYEKSLTLAEADKILLCTHVGGEVLSHKHGYPLRAVVPSRRGWFWVKWLSGIQLI